MVVFELVAGFVICSFIGGLCDGDSSCDIVVVGVVDGSF